MFFSLLKIWKGTVIPLDGRPLRCARVQAISSERKP